MAEKNLLFDLLDERAQVGHKLHQLFRVDLNCLSDVLYLGILLQNQLGERNHAEKYDQALVLLRKPVEVTELDQVLCHEKY